MTLEVQKESYDFVGMLEITEKDLIIQDTDKFDWDLVPVTDDWGSKIVENGLRITQWMKDRVEVAEDIRRRLTKDTLKVEELYKNPGWFRCWMTYYRLEYDQRTGSLCYINKKHKEKVGRR